MSTLYFNDDGIDHDDTDLSGGEGKSAAPPDWRFDINNPPPVSREGLTITRDPFRYPKWPHTLAGTTLPKFGRLARASAPLLMLVQDRILSVDIVRIPFRVVSFLITTLDFASLQPRTAATLRRAGRREVRRKSGCRALKPVKPGKGTRKGISEFRKRVLRLPSTLDVELKSATLLFGATGLSFFLVPLTLSNRARGTKMNRNSE
jgi:hypothetical protein